MLVADAKERTYKKKFVCQKHKACKKKMPFKYDLDLNVIISFKVSVYKLIIMNFSQVYKDKRNFVSRYNLT